MRLEFWKLFFFRGIKVGSKIEANSTIVVFEIGTREVFRDSSPFKKKIKIKFISNQPNDFMKIDGNFITNI